MLRLEKIHKDNVWQILELKVAEYQKDYVATNSESIIDAYVSAGTGCIAFPFGIYDDEKPVGFMMIGYDTNGLYEDGHPIMDGNYLLWRFMIDEKYQKQGYGGEAIRLAMEFVRTWPCGKAEYLVTVYEPENAVARKLYRDWGFEEIGEQDDGEDIAVLKL